MPDYCLPWEPARVEKVETMPNLNLKWIKYIFWDKSHQEVHGPTRPQLPHDPTGIFQPTYVKYFYFFFYFSTTSLHTWLWEVGGTNCPQTRKKWETFTPPFDTFPSPHFLLEYWSSVRDNPNRKHSFQNWKRSICDELFFFWVSKTNTWNEII